eukprot:snap_masked-scaffold_21-processed-gene-4.36-mRNA-1 protein AED:1.00 eAED:1.00 QI:0/0/0/0/1/1/2/0/269
MKFCCGCITEGRKRRIRTKEPNNFTCSGGEFKVSILGLDGSGKSTFFNGVQGKFKRVVPTMGVSKPFLYILEQEKAKLKLFDIGGGISIRGIWRKRIISSDATLVLFHDKAANRSEELLQELKKVDLPKTVFFIIRTDKGFICDDLRKTFEGLGILRFLLLPEFKGENENSKKHYLNRCAEIIQEVGGSCTKSNLKSEMKNKSVKVKKNQVLPTEVARPSIKEDSVVLCRNVDGNGNRCNKEAKHRGENTNWVPFCTACFENQGYSSTS